MKIRIMEIEEPKFPYKFSTSADAHKAVKDYGKADRECFLVLFLNATNVLIDSEVLTVGALDTAAVYPREVLKSAILRNASSIIVAHNHPSGDLTPSRADIEITRQVMAACAIVQIRMLDHIILGRNTYLSMADSGEITNLHAEIKRDLTKCGIGGVTC